MLRGRFRKWRVAAGLIFYEVEGSRAQRRTRWGRKPGARHRAQRHPPAAPCLRMRDPRSNVSADVARGRQGHFSIEEWQNSIRLGEATRGLSEGSMLAYASTCAEKSVAKASRPCEQGRRAKEAEEVRPVDSLCESPVARCRRPQRLREFEEHL